MGASNPVRPKLPIKQPNQTANTNPTARPLRRPRNAHPRQHRLRLLHRLDLAYGTWLPTLSSNPTPNSTFPQPFVDDSHAIQSLFPPRVWAIRIPVILLLLGGAVVGSFLSVVMVRSNRKKAAKAAKAQQQKAQ